MTSDAVWIDSAPTSFAREEEHEAQDLIRGATATRPCRRCVSYDAGCRAISRGELQGLDVVETMGPAAAMSSGQ